MLHYICLQDRQLMYLYAFVNSKKKKRKKVETWVKISKVMPLSPHSIPWEREGSLMAKSPSPSAKQNTLWPCTFFDSPSSKTTCKNSKFLFQFKFTVNHTDFMQFATNSSTLSFNTFRLLTIGRELHEK